MQRPFHGIAIVLLLSLPSVADDWPQFRGPNADGVADATGVPIRWSATENVAWKTPIPGSGWSSPVLAHDRVYLTTADAGEDAGDGSLRAVCVDAADGKILWNVEVFQPEANVTRQVHTKNTLASSTPIVTDDRLFVHFGHMGTAALDLGGNVIWRQQKLRYPPVHGNGGSPVLVDNLLVFSCDGASDPFVAALDQAGGEVRWQTPRNTSASKTFSFSSPIVIDVDGAQQVISAGSGFVGGYEPQDGRELWRVKYGEGYSVVPRPVFAHGLVFVATGFNRAELLAIDPRGAEGDATENVVWRYGRGVSLTPSLLVVGNELYLVSDNGVATCLDARSGTVHWTERLAGDFSASPVFANGNVYFTNEAGTTYVVRADRTYALVATNDLEERTLASPAVVNGSIFLRTESHLWRVGER
jgi:outer membrane protein assembly factor BamB